MPDPPVGLARLRAVGPGFVWMMAAAGSGELLFTPIIASQYGYQMLWALLLAVSLKWFVNREIGRYTVCTGTTVLQGWSTLPGPRAWAVWLIVVPQLVVAAASLAGLASASATAPVLFLPGGTRLWTAMLLVVSATLLLLGHYKRLEGIARAEAALLGVAAVTAAVTIFPTSDRLVEGLRPQLPDDLLRSDVVPWLAYLLAGAAGMMWYSYWLIEKGYGVAIRQTGSGALAEPPPSDPSTVLLASPEHEHRLRGWVRQMTLDTTIAVVGATIITTAFLVLGAELLQPRGLVPDEARMAQTLGRLLGDLWGPVGFWFMTGSLGVALWATTLSNQDGFARLLSDGTRLLAGSQGRWGRWVQTDVLRRILLLALLTTVPALLFAWRGQPVALLALAGSIEAIQLPESVVIVCARTCSFTENSCTGAISQIRPSSTVRPPSVHRLGPVECLNCSH